MSTSPPADLWSLVPASLKSAVLVAVTTIFLAGALLYQDNTGSELRPDFAQGGPIAGNLANPAPDEIVIATPTPLVRGDPRSAATLTAPRSSITDEVNGPPFPALGRYVFAVEGTESASLFGSRAFGPEMTMTVHRRSATDTSDPPLERDELAFDLDFSAEHQERAIVAYRRDGIMFTYEAQTLTFGPSTQSSAATYEPPILQVPIPLVEGADAEGTTTATSPEDGSEVRVEDWKVEVLRRERIAIMGTDVDTLVVRVDRQSQPGAAQPLTRSRTYWLDPVRAIWVKWEERSSGRHDAGLGSMTYTSTYTATLERIEPL